MLEFYKTVGGRKFCDHTIPELIRKLDKVAALDFDGLTKAMNRLAKAMEDANRLQNKEPPPNFGPMEVGEAKAFVEQLMVHVNLAGKEGLVLRGNNARQIMYCTSLLDDLPIAFSPEGDWVRVWKVGISDNQAELEVKQILKAMRESDKDTFTCSEEIAKLIRDNERVRCRLIPNGVRIDDEDGVMVLTKPVKTMTDEEIFNFVERLVAEIGEKGLTVRGKPYRTIRENDQVRAVLMAKGVRIEMDEEDDSADLYIGEAE